jgi:NADPH:quinone reductase-like Zn-dependent oxidoreductase
VIDKSSCGGSAGLWAKAAMLSPSGYCAIFDANGIETLKQSYDHLSINGRLIVYGFHSNLPKNNAFLSPFQWLKMAYSLAMMPKFDAMDMTLTSKSIAGFNLSFFANETELMAAYLAQIIDWAAIGAIAVPDVTLFDMCNIQTAHELMQSGKSIGKLVIRTRASKDECDAAGTGSSAEEEAAASSCISAATENVSIDESLSFTQPARKTKARSNRAGR